MNLTKMSLLIGLTLTVLALTGLGQASATEYGLYHSGGGTISKHTEIPLSGKFKFKTASTGMECQVHATVTTQTGTSLNTKLSKFEITTATCAGFGSLYEGCEASKDTITGLPWAVEVKKEDLSISEIEIDTKNKAKAGKECFPTTTNLNFSALTAKPNSVTKIESFTVSGAGTAETNVGNLNISAEGTLEVTGAAKGTYGIEELNPPPPVDLITDAAGIPLVNQKIQFEGKAEFNTLGSGIECTATMEIEVNGTTIKPTKFEAITTAPPAAGCKFFGAQYQECAFEQHPTAIHLNLASIVIDTDGAGNAFATVLAPKNTETHPTLLSELGTRAGSTNACNVTTNDLTVVSEAGANLQADILKGAGGHISGVKLKGQVRIDRGSLAAGTATPAAVNLVVGVGGTLNLESGTYKVGSTP